MRPERLRLSWRGRIVLLIRDRLDFSKVECAGCGRRRWWRRMISGEVYRWNEPMDYGWWCGTCHGPTK